MSLVLLIGGCQTFPVNGQGNYTYSNGDKHSGEFKNGEMTGKGTYTYHMNGDKYVGDHVDGKFHGQGILYFFNGDKYVGEFRNGMRNGQGTLIISNGEEKQGVWRNGHLTISGFLYVDNQKECQIFTKNTVDKIIKWNGKCIDGFAEGKGFAEHFEKGILGTTYEGSFVRGILNGRGTEIGRAHV